MLKEVTHTLQIQRYTTQELINFITQEFYKSLCTSQYQYFMQKQINLGVSHSKYLYSQRQEKIQATKYRLKDLQARIKQETGEDLKIYQQGIAITKTMLNLYNNWEINNQKEVHNTIKDIFSTHSFITIPLNKKINGLYDDFNAIIIYYDNLSSSLETISAFENITSPNEKIVMAKEKTEITHIILSLNSTTSINIALSGQLNTLHSNIKKEETTILPIKFSDFTTLTLQECEEIKNNDLAQIVQERIDMDKENLIKLAHLTIKGEEYQIFKSPYTNKEYIRYICPSTQRVYYNLLNHNYLKTSKYYIQGNAESYIKAWYSIANLFIELTEEEILRPSIAC